MSRERTYPFPCLADCFDARQGHPYLFFRAGQVEELRLRCGDGDAGAGYAAIRASVLDAIQTGRFPVSPPRDECRGGGAHQRWIAADQQALNLVANSALVALVEDDPSLVEAAYAFALRRMSWPKWTHPKLPWSTVDLRSSATLMTMAIVYDLLFDHLSDDRRIELESVCWERGLARMVENLDCESWASRFDSNWCAVCCAGVAIAALAFARGGHQSSEGYLRLAEACARRLWRYFDEYEPGGAWREGLTYWAYGTGLALTLAHALRSATAGKVDCFQHPIMDSIGDFPLRCHLPPDRMVNFGDAYTHPWITPVHLKLAQERGDGRHLWFFQQHRGHYRTNQLDIFRVLWWPHGAVPQAPTMEPASMHYPRVGWTIFRSDGRDTNALIVPVKIGTTRDPHGHADVGTFIVHAGGTTFLRDLGIPLYGHPDESIFRSTAGHNLPTFDGRGQVREQPRAGKITHVDLGGPTETLVADLTEAYAYEPVRRYNRTFSFHRPDRLEVVDQLELASAVAMEARFHFEGVPSLAGRQLVLRSGQWEMCLAVETDQPCTLSLGRHENLVTVSHESASPITVPFLEVRAQLTAPSATIRYTIVIREVAP